jgi:hypothetical protein
MPDIFITMPKELRAEIEAIAGRGHVGAFIREAVSQKLKFLRQSQTPASRTPAKTRRASAKKKRA